MKKLLVSVMFFLGMSIMAISTCYADGPYVEALILSGSNTMGNVGINTGSNIIGAVKTDKVNYTTFNKIASGSTVQTRRTLWTPTSGAKAVITDVIMSSDTNLRVEFQDASSTTVTGPFFIGANRVESVHLTTPLKSAAADNVISYSTDIPGNHFIEMLGYEE